VSAGVQGFIGGRLREVREARGIPASSLAEILGVSRQAITQYEGGTVLPGSETLHRMANTLNIPLAFLFLPARQQEDIPIFYRSMAAATKYARSKAERRLSWLNDIVSYLLDFVELPPIHFPVLDLPSNVTAITSSMIEEAAAEVRRFWNHRDGPISNLAWLLENNGAIVTRGVLDAETLDALSARLDGGLRPYIFLGADKESAARSRFDIAHELGHLVLHRSTTARDVSRSEMHRLLEDQAHAFAGAFLLPSASFLRDLPAPTLDACRAMKAKWGVSIKAMVYRLKALGILSDDEARAMFISYSRRGWRKHEPLDSELEPEQPRALAQAITLLVDENIVTKEQLIADLALSPMDIEQLAGLPTGYLEDMPPLVRLLDRSHHHAGGRVQRATGLSEVIDFTSRE